MIAPELNSIESMFFLPRDYPNMLTGVLNDFLDWLWDNVMLDLSKYIWKERFWTSYEVSLY